MAPRISEEVAARLVEAIGWFADRPRACARDPGRDFTRSRKLPPGVLLLIVTWAQETVDAELADLLGWDGRAPSGAALTQQMESTFGTFGGAYDTSRVKEMTKATLTLKAKHGHTAEKRIQVILVKEDGKWMLASQNL